MNSFKCSVPHTTIWKLFLVEGFDYRNPVLGLGSWGFRENRLRLATFMGKGTWNGFSSGTKSSWRPENCYFLTFAFPYAPVGWYCPLLAGYIMLWVSIRGHSALGQHFLKLPAFHMGTVYSGSDWIWSAELSWAWGVFLTLGLLFLVLNILL